MHCNLLALEGTLTTAIALVMGRTWMVIPYCWGYGTGWNQADSNLELLPHVLTFAVPEVDSLLGNCCH